MEKSWYNADENWLSKVKIKEKEVIVKVHDSDFGFHSVRIPTDYFPLKQNKDYAYKLFTQENTEECTDLKVLEAFNSVTYKFGHCYRNSEELKEALHKKGIEAKLWSGWLFAVGDESLPFHHCWLSVGNSILDLSDDMALRYCNKNIKRWEEVETSEDYNKVLADFYTFCKNNHVPNSARCCPVGKIGSPNWMYVGSECDSADEAIEIYKKMIKKFPNHIAYANCFNGTNAAQRYIKNVLGGYAI